MGGLPLPKLKRCCFCTRKLKVACILIVIWCMLITCHSMSILFYPACCDQYNENSGDFSEELSLLMWLLFGFNMVTLLSSFAYLLGLFWGYRITADIFMLFGFLSAVTMFAHALFTIFQMIDAGDCSNPSDAIAFIIYASLWCYFIFIINSHRDNM